MNAQQTRSEVGGPARLALAFAVAIVAGGAGLPVHAKEVGEYLSYNVGRLAIQPQLDSAATYTDNLFFSSANRAQDALQLTVSPGLRLQYGEDKANQASLEYYHDFVTYFVGKPSDPTVIPLKGQDLTQDRLDLGLSYALPRTRLDGKSSLQFLSGYVGGNLNQAGRVVDRRIWVDDYKITYDSSAKTDVYFDGSHADYDYNSGLSLYDQNNLTGSLGATYKYSEAVGFFGEGFYGQSAINPNVVGAPKGPHSDVYGGYLGMRGDFTTKLTGSIRLGYEVRDFSDGKSRSSDTPGIRLDIRYTAGLKTTLGLAYDRRTLLSPQYAGQSYISDAVTLSATQVVGTTYKWFVRGSFRYDRGEHTQNLIEVNSGGTKITYDTARNEDRFEASLSLNYQPQPWMTASLIYAYERYDVSFVDSRLVNSLVDYNINRITLQLSLGY